jgi:hypothetical protein
MVFKIDGLGTLAVKRRKRALHAETFPVSRLTRDVLINHYVTVEDNE